jgi:hypothetical protein
MNVRARGVDSTSMKALRTWSTIALALLAVHCGGDPKRSVAAMDTDAGSDDAAALVVCPEPQGPDVPSGSCVGAGLCAFRQIVVCGPGVPAIPSTPPLYDCSCGGGTWECIAKSGGFGITPCDGGEDAAPDTGNDSSSSMDGT